jgi:hypothetical protein
MAEILPET